ncbi:MAG TPA: FAD-dependent monooxygenase, partial [Acidimicrobiales bacterium]|nr:FAD-dependent monooxygenase [Acidimicrobiales bacterium]
ARIEWLLGEVEVAAPPEELAAVAAEVPAPLLQFGPTPHAEGAYGFVVRTEEVAEERAAPPTLEEFKQRLRELAGTDFGVHSPRRLTRFGDATRQAERYRSGRVLLAGDAAHIHPPIGGQGLNLGVQDAFNLGWKLAAEVQGRAPDGLLDSYHAERHPVGARVLQNTRAQGVLNRQDEDTADLRAIFADLLRLHDVNRHLSGMVSGLDVRYEMPGGGAHPALGGWLPDLDLAGVSPGAGQCRVSRLVRPARGLLLELGGHPEFGNIAARWAHRVDNVVARTADPLAASDWSGVDGVGAMLLRPDGHVCWVTGASGDPPSPDSEASQQLEEALARWFGPSSVSGTGG